MLLFSITPFLYFGCTQKLSKSYMLISILMFIFSNFFCQSNFFESAKLRALRAKNVLTCLACLSAHVPTCLACSSALRTYVLTGQRAYVLTCQHASFDATFFSFAPIVAEVVHSVDKA